MELHLAAVRSLLSRTVSSCHRPRKEALYLYRKPHIADCKSRKRIMAGGMPRKSEHSSAAADNCS